MMKPRILMKKSLALSHNSREIIRGIKALKNAHRLFSISEMTSLAKQYESEIKNENQSVPLVQDNETPQKGQLGPNL